MAADETCRLKREEYKRTKHDPGFSKWEILIGPSDWKNFSLGKDGTERYRIHNLPISCSCPGVYELGIATSPTDVGRKTRELNASQIIVLYLGQADNVRTRLQQYGRAGSHLDHGNSIGLLNEDKSSCLARGPGLFREVFLRGFPIVFRWVPMRNKKEAEKAESQLLGIFDYAWNKGGNGDRRHDDVLLKLDKEALGTIDFNLHSKFGHWNWRTFSKNRVGLKILTSMPSNDTMPTSDSRRNLGFWISKFSKNHPIVVPENGVGKGNYTMCGVFLGDGSVCKNRPIEGRKRCAEHKGEKINGLISRSVISREEIIKGKGSSVLVIEDDIMCGVFLGDGSVCKNRPIEGRKRCAEHKGEKINGLISREEIIKGKGSSVLVIEDHLTCGASLGDGSVCRSRPIEGRKRCGRHKGKRINQP